VSRTTVADTGVVRTTGMVTSIDHSGNSWRQLTLADPDATMWRAMPSRVLSKDTDEEAVSVKLAAIPDDPNPPLSRWTQLPLPYTDCRCTDADAAPTTSASATRVPHDW
jgi:hypothetical protein